jgi:hypothetical protein
VGRVGNGAVRARVRVIALVALVGACSAGPTAPAPTAGSGGVHGGLADPGLRSVTVDVPAARGATIGRDGGVIELTGPGGITYRLDIPKGALRVPTEVGVYPVTGVAALPSGTTLRAGVQFVPDGTRLLVPATLTIALPAGARAEGATGYGWNGDGADGHVALWAPAADTVTMPIRHFSGDGLVAPLPLESLGPECGSDDAMERGLGRLVATGTATSAEFADLLRACYATLVDPSLRIGIEAASAEAPSAVTEEATIDRYNLWLEGIRIAALDLGDSGFTLSPEVADSRALAATFLRAWYDAHNAECRAEGAATPSDRALAIADADTAMRAATLAERWGVDTPAARLDDATLRADLCVQVRFDAEAEYTASQPGQTGSLRVVAGYSVAGGPEIHDEDLSIVVLVGSTITRGATDASGRSEQDVAWPETVDPIEIAIQATVLQAGAPTDISAFGFVRKSSSGSVPTPAATGPAPTPSATGAVSVAGRYAVTVKCVNVDGFGNLGSGSATLEQRGAAITATWSVDLSGAAPAATCGGTLVSAAPTSGSFSGTVTTDASGALVLVITAVTTDACAKPLLHPLDRPWALGTFDIPEGGCTPDLLYAATSTGP